MVAVTISGHPGSGTSTLVDRLCHRLGWSKLNGGEVFRMVAEERGIELEEFSRLCDEEPEVDMSLDERLRFSMTEPDGPQIVESRLAGWWAHKLELECLKVWLQVSIKERARRVVIREGGDLDDAEKRINERQQADQKRYSNLYSLSLDELTPYNLIIEADSLNPEQVEQLVVSALSERGEIQ